MLLSPSLSPGYLSEGYPFSIPSLIIKADLFSQNSLPHLLLLQGLMFAWLGWKTASHRDPPFLVLL